MNQEESPGPLVLGIYPSTRGFGFVLLQGPLRPVDWGLRTAQRHKNEVCLKKVAALIDLYHPKLLVIDDYTGEGSKRCYRIQRLIDRICELSAQNNVPVLGYSKGQVQTYFAHYHAKTRHEIAITIATWMPGFLSRLPAKRKPWMSEPSGMAMFNAIAIVLTHYYFQRHIRT